MNERLFVRRTAVMPQHEQFITSVVCPRCGQGGVVKLEHSELPVYQRGEWSTSFTRISPGLRLGAKAKVLCARCGIEVVIGARMPQSGSVERA